MDISVKRIRCGNWLTGFLRICFGVLITLRLCPWTNVEALEITQQPQNPINGTSSYATYSVTADGEALRCRWFLEFQGDVYDITQKPDYFQPWMEYAGVRYGAQTEGNTFTYFFDGIHNRMDGAVIYAVLSDGEETVTSQRATIQVDGSVPAPAILVPADVVVKPGDTAVLHCEPVESDLSVSYLWYETATGQLSDIVPVNRGLEERSVLNVSMECPGTRYFVCMVTTSQGGRTYSSVIPVTAAESPTIVTDVLPEATVGETYQIQLHSSDADAVYSVQEEDSLLKIGLQLTENGCLQGIPRNVGRYPFTVMATGVGGTSSKSFALVVREAFEPYLQILSKPDRLVYTVGDTVDLTGLKVRYYSSAGEYVELLDGEGLTISVAPFSEEGVHQITVSRAGESQTFPVTVKAASHVHSYKDWKVVIEVGCTEDGRKIGICSCGMEKVTSIAAKGHEMDEGRVQTEPSVGQEGQRIYTCTACGYTRSKVIPAIEEIMQETSTVPSETTTEASTVAETVSTDAEDNDAVWLWLVPLIVLFSMAIGFTIGYFIIKKH